MSKIGFFRDHIIADTCTSPLSGSCDDPEHSDEHRYKCYTTAWLMHARLPLFVAQKCRVCWLAPYRRVGYDNELNVPIWQRLSGKRHCVLLFQGAAVKSPEGEWIRMEQAVIDPTLLPRDSPVEAMSYMRALADNYWGISRCADFAVHAESADGSFKEMQIIR